MTGVRERLRDPRLNDPGAWTKEPQLHVAEGVSLGLDYVTQTAAILAQRRKGKTYLACDIAEELVYAEMPWVALDPTGAWWGLRSSADGESAGLPVVVIGGQHGDLPLEREGGAVVADLVLDHPGWYVLDFSLLGSRAAEREFAAAFGDRLHRRKMQPGMDFPLHLFVDEADLFVPQEKETTWNTSGRRGQPDVLAVYQGIVRRGGLHGLGSTLISQRPALVNKNALTQIDVLFLLRLVAGQDQDAVFKNNVSRFLPKNEAEELMATLATLPVGEGWILEPGADPPLRARVRFRERNTFNSSATPKAGERRIEPRVLADVDLEDLRERMAGALERAQEDDPDYLRRERDQARRQLHEAQAELHDLHAWASELAASTGEDAVEEVVAAYMLAKRDVGFSCDVVDEVRALRDAPHTLDSAAVERIAAAAVHIEQAADVARQASVRLIVFVEDLAVPAEKPLAPAPSSRPVAPPRISTPSQRPALAVVSPHPDRSRSGPEAAIDPGASDGAGISPAQQKILDALGWWRALRVLEPSVAQVAFVVGRHPRSKGFTNNLGALSTAGLILRDSGLLALTAAGDRLARQPLQRPTEAELHALIYEQIGPARARMLERIIDLAGEWMLVDDLAAAMNYHPRSKGFTNNLGSLSGLGLIEREPGRVRASELCYLVN